MRAFGIAALLLISALPVSAKPAAQPSIIAASVANTTARTPDNVKLDDARKPAQVLALLGLKRHQHTGKMQKQVITIKYSLFLFTLMAAIEFAIFTMIANVHG